jgi:hypothetical protein
MISDPAMSKCVHRDLVEGVTRSSASGEYPEFDLWILHVQ